MAEKKLRKLEQWQDMIARLYPEIVSKDGERVLSRTVTFQVTNACNLNCFVAGTKILMSDYSYKNIEDIKVGDEIMGFNEEIEKGKQRKLNPTKVTHTFYRHDNIYRIQTVDGEDVLCTKEHPFLDGRGDWKRAEDISIKHKLNKFPGDMTLREVDIMDENYMIGYIISTWLGDGQMRFFKHGVLRESSSISQDRLAVKDIEIIKRNCLYLDHFNIEYYLKPYKVSEKYNIIEDALYLNIESASWLKNLILNNLNINTSYEYLCGFLAGIIDTEGNVNTDSCYIRIFNSNLDIIKQCEYALNKLNYKYTFDKDRQGENYIVKTIRTINERGSIDTLNLLRTIQNSVERKSCNAFKNHAFYGRVNVKLTEDLNTIDTVYNLETESHTYIANNFLVHNCNYCYQINKGKERMSFDTAKEFVDLLLSGEKGFSDYINPEISPAIVIEFIGGEPFLEIELIDKIVDYFRERTIELMHPWATNYCISICSNGVNYFDERVQKFLNKNKDHMSFSITIDGNKELHDSCRVFPDGSPSYDIAVAGANDWIAKGNYMGSKITIAPGNLSYLYDAIIHMISLGYLDINANCVYEKGWEQEHAIEFYKQLKDVADYFIDNDLVGDVYCSLFEESFFKPKNENDLQNWCGGTALMLACDPNGYLYPCIRYMESSLGDSRPPMRIGSIYDGIGKNKCYMDCIHCLKNIDRRTQSTDECFYCPIGEGCSWCSAYNFQEFGTPNKRATYICEMHKARSLANVYLWNKYYHKHNLNKKFKMYCPKEWALNIISEDEYNMLLELSE